MTFNFRAKLILDTAISAAIYAGLYKLEVQFIIRRIYFVETKLFILKELRK